jgi:hypothetical protein
MDLFLPDEGHGGEGEAEAAAASAAAVHAAAMNYPFAPGAPMPEVQPFYLNQDGAAALPAPAPLEPAPAPPVAAPVVLEHPPQDLIIGLLFSSKAAARACVEAALQLEDKTIHVDKSYGGSRQARFLCKQPKNLSGPALVQMVAQAGDAAPSSTVPGACQFVVQLTQQVRPSAYAMQSSANTMPQQSQHFSVHFLVPF